MGRPDIVVGRTPSADVAYEPEEAEESTAVGVLDVEVPVNDKLEEWFLEIHDVETARWSRSSNPLSFQQDPHARAEEYIKKRRRIFGSRTNLVEVDLLPPASRCRCNASRLDRIIGS